MQVWEVRYTRNVAASGKQDVIVIAFAETSEGAIIQVKESDSTFYAMKDIKKANTDVPIFIWHGGDYWEVTKQ